MKLDFISLFIGICIISFIATMVYMWIEKAMHMYATNPPQRIVREVKQTPRQVIPVLHNDFFSDDFPLLRVEDFKR